MADLTGVRAKLRRAEEHRQAYDDLFESYLAASPYAIIFEYDPETGWHTFRWSVESEPPLEELALIFSDILGNLRSTLDYLVWQLVLLGGRKPGRQTAFPVVKREKDWRVQGGAALQGVPEEWAALIEAMQPFHRFDRPDLHPLAILEHVNNLTKHRFLPAAVLTADAFGYLINVAGCPAGRDIREPRLPRPPDRRRRRARPLPRQVPRADRRAGEREPALPAVLSGRRRDGVGPGRPRRLGARGDRSVRAGVLDLRARKST